MTDIEKKLIDCLKECIAEFECYDMQKETILLIDKINSLIKNEK